MDELRRVKREIEGQPAMGLVPTPERPFVLQLAGRTYICESLRAWSEALDHAMARAVRATHTREAGSGPAQP